MTSVEQVGILYNPRAGKRQASSFASSISVYLASRGLRVRSRESSRMYQADDIKSFLEESDVLVVVGGDGTFRELIPLLATSNIPVILFPAGNESLVARKFGVSRSIPDLYERIARGSIEEHFFGFCNEIPFFLMASSGLDSEIVRIVDGMRTEGSSNFLYIKAFLKSLFTYKRAVFSICDDHDRNPSSFMSGSFIVANSSIYARDFNPASEANSRSEEFFARVFPENKSGMISNWFCSAVFRTPVSTTEAFHKYGSHFFIKSEHPFPLQLDGDYAGEFTEIEFRKSREKLRFVV